VNAEAAMRVVANVEIQAVDAEMVVLRVDYRPGVRAEKLMETS
jgi:hypothetical protein